jgi:Flp pilus assembly pilin Flp
MAHYKDTEKGQGLFLTVNLSEQIVPGTFEHHGSFNRRKLDLSIFNRKYNNDETGAAAIEPGILLKIILYFVNNYLSNLFKNIVLAQLAHNVCYAMGVRTQN